MGEDSCHCVDLPTEVLLYIFSFLPGRDLIRSRQVCHRWKLVVDGMSRSEVLWRQHCRKDFNQLYKVARDKSRSGLCWFNIYRSLALWPQLIYARETRDEFASAESINDEIRNFEVLPDGILAVHKRDSIVYYDIETCEQSKRSPISGNYMNFTENQHMIVIQSFQLHMFVIRKVLHSPCLETNVTFDGVKNFLLVGKEVYFINLNNEIYVCKLVSDAMTPELLATSDEDIVCMGYGDALNILTFERNIYSISNKSLVLKTTLDNGATILPKLYEYKLLETVEWRIIMQWTVMLRHRIPSGPLEDIKRVRVYGDIVLVGCNWGVLRIYHKPFVDGQFDFYNTEPVKQYNFMERSDCPVLTLCPIIKVDVLESEDGHTVVVGMPKKIAVVDFIHTFKRSASVAMLPYYDVQKVKFMKREN